MTDQRIDMGSTEDCAWVLQREVLQLPEVLRFVFDGEPVSKSRARFTKKGYKGHAYTPEKTRQAEDRIAWLAKQGGIHGPAVGDKTFGLFAKFFCGTWMRRDVDNMVKLVADALTGIVWVDDAQVTEISGAVQRGVPDARTHVLVYETKGVVAPTRPCGVCQKPVRQYKSQPNNYCSKECSYEGQRIQVPLTCLTCGEVYTLPQARAARIKNAFCSEACRYRAQRVEGPCAQCGAHVSRPRSWAKKALFCSNACVHLYRIGKPRGGSAV